MENQEPSTSNKILNTLAGIKKVFTSFKQPESDEEWPQVAIDMLVKRMMKSRGKQAGMIEIEKLERALSNPDMPSPCITIPRTSDGRIQVSVSFPDIHFYVNNDGRIVFVARLVIAKDFRMFCIAAFGAGPISKATMNCSLSRLVSSILKPN